VILRRREKENPIRRNYDITIQYYVHISMEFGAKQKT
jgi:hypothetical protein